MGLKIALFLRQRQIYFQAGVDAVYHRLTDLAGITYIYVTVKASCVSPLVFQVSSIREHAARGKRGDRMGNPLGLRRFTYRLHQDDHFAVQR